MIQASCPSCGAPVVFAHGDALTAACDRCHSLLVRSDRDVRAVGRVSAFDRDLSPVQLEASGIAGKRRFRVVGVVRLGRERVRWNEWALLFDDGGTGWLGESNGQHWLFEGEGVRASPPADLRVGRTFDGPGGRWVVQEAATATILAAEGSLSWQAPADLRRRYADLRREGGGVGTLDFEDPSAPVLYAGRTTTLVELRMEGLRPVTGWDDPALTHFRGAEIGGVRKLDCPSCGAGIELNGGALAVRVVCAYCGVASDLDEGGAPQAEEHAPRQARPVWEPPLPLGTRGKLRGGEWQVIGAMERSVRVDGVRYPWTEYFLHNPWRGGAWLVEAAGHWSFVELLGDLPHANVMSASWAGRSHRAFQSGSAQVDRVLGEFTWQVAVGDRSKTRDYVADGTMLSREDAEDEVTWSFGHYLPKEEVEAFARRTFPAPRGIAPHQPNPFTGVVVATNLVLAGGIAALAVGLQLVASFMSADEVTPVSFADLSTGDVAVANLTVPDVARRDTRLSLSCAQTDGVGAVATLLHEPTGNVYEQSWTGARTTDVEWRLEPGPYAVRVEMVSTTTPDNDCTLVLHRDEGSSTVLWAGLAAAAGAAIFTFMRRQSFESARWQESDFA